MQTEMTVDHAPIEGKKKMKRPWTGAKIKDGLGLPGQKFQTPSENDGTRIFYETLLQQRPESRMARQYCVEFGLI